MGGSLEKSNADCCAFIQSVRRMCADLDEGNIASDVQKVEYRSFSPEMSDVKRAVRRCRGGGLPVDNFYGSITKVCWKWTYRKAFL